MGVFGGDPKLSDRMRLWELCDQVIFEPTHAHTSQFLSINRESGDLDWIGQLPASAGGQPSKPIIIFGLVGVVRLLAGTYALVITERQCVGAYRGAPVYLINSMKFLCCNSTLKLQTPQEKRDEANFAHLLKAVEATPGLYYSYEVDLTLSAQRAHDLADHRVIQPLWKQGDPRFLWNKHLLEELIENKMEPYILPVIQGSFQQIVVEVRDKTVSVTLVSRRCIRRIGTRMWRRGADRQGHVANFVETEQILDCDGHTASYVQVRGSIPVLWEQIVDLSYKPEIKTIQLDETVCLFSQYILGVLKHDDLIPSPKLVVPYSTLVIHLTRDVLEHRLCCWICVEESLRAKTVKGLSPFVCGECLEARKSSFSFRPFV